MSVRAPVRFGVTHRRQALIFAVLANVLPVLVATLSDLSTHRTVFYVGAAGACIAPFVVMFVPRRRRALFYLGAYGGLPMITLMLAYHGGAASGYSVLLMMAMCWYGFQATDREMVVGFALLAACVFVPMVAVGGPAYPPEVGHGILLLMVGTSVTMSLRVVTRETQRLNAKLREEAVHDGLTGLLNRRGWEEAAGRELARVLRRGAPLTLVLVDLDRLKQVNDSLGHHEGDRILRETAERVSSALRAGDIVARLGGDEFAALLSDTTADDAVAILSRLRTRTPEEAAFSAGVAQCGSLETLDELQRRADLALYAAKSAGAGRTEMAPAALSDLPA
jgi:diguanylate cyclase (GGDEF)-like protein